MSCWPPLKILFLLRLWSMIFPCSDFRHVVMTPAMLLMCEYLMRCPILTGRDVAVGSFLCSMVLSVCLTEVLLVFYSHFVLRLMPSSFYLCSRYRKKIKNWHSLFICYRLLISFKIEVHHSIRTLNSIKWKRGEKKGRNFRRFCFFLYLFILKRGM